MYSSFEVMYYMGSKTILLFKLCAHMFNNPSFLFHANKAYVYPFGNNCYKSFYIYMNYYIKIRCEVFKTNSAIIKGKILKDT